LNPPAPIPIAEYTGKGRQVLALKLFILWALDEICQTTPYIIGYVTREFFQSTPEDRLKTKIRRAFFSLKQDGLVVSLGRGTLIITTKGKKLLERDPATISATAPPGISWGYPCLCGHIATSRRQCDNHRRKCSEWKNRDTSKIKKQRHRQTRWLSCLKN